VAAELVTRATLCCSCSPVSSGVFRGALGDAPHWPEHKNFLNTLNQKKFSLISGERAQPPPQTPSSVGRGHPLPTLHPIGASNLTSLALAPPSQNPKYATACVCLSLCLDLSVYVTSGQFPLEPFPELRSFKENFATACRIVDHRSELNE